MLALADFWISWLFGVLDLLMWDYTVARGQQSVQFHLKLSLTHHPECNTNSACSPHPVQFVQLKKQKVVPCPHGVFFLCKNGTNRKTWRNILVFSQMAVGAFFLANFVPNYENWQKVIKSCAPEAQRVPRGSARRFPDGSPKVPRRFPKGSPKVPRRFPVGQTMIIIHSLYFVICLW